MPRWRGRWEWAIVVGSFVPALLWGVAWTNIVRGVPIDADHEYTGNFFDLLPYALLGGVLTLVLFLAHGAIFLALRTTGELSDAGAPRSPRAAPWPPVVAVAAFLAWLLRPRAIAAACRASRRCSPRWPRSRGRGAPCSCGRATAGRSPPPRGAIILLFGALFADLFPNAMVSSTNAASRCRCRRVLVALHAGRDDRRRAAARAVRAALPGLDLLGLPRAPLARRGLRAAARPARRRPQRPPQRR